MTFLLFCRNLPGKANLKNDRILLSGACSIELTSKPLYSAPSWEMKGVILTGGRPARWNRFNNRRVVHYDINGFVSDLPNLKSGRMDHACSFYYRVTGRNSRERVSNTASPFFFYNFRQ